ncbi:hypothetical protein TIFTF001_019720 [Ficus carica]|uniref:Uncharacterized protein n=1 Tax=Ficus carica TaxID=3494 RepID=A0AA88ADI9_FICCA|nr:hypothetical protein TIFTF001_019720 [Ficus carica]
MNRGVLQSSPVQQMMAAAGNPNWWNINTMRPPTHHHQPPSNSPFLAPPNFYPQFVPTSSSHSSSLPSWHDNNQDQQLPESWSQLLLGGLVGEEEKGNMMSHFQVKKLENWEEQMLSSTTTQAPNASVADVKQEHSSASGGYVYGHHGSAEDQFQAVAKPPSGGGANNWSPHHQMMASTQSSPKSCVTSFSSNMLDFSNKPDHRHAARHPVPPVPAERALSETDTASVLLEAIGYIRFLQSQIEALSLPYLGNGSGNMRQQQSVHGERNCMFPEDPGQLLNENGMKRKGAPDQQDSLEEPKKDLRSRGLCLVPVSCTLQVGSDNGADYWAPALGGGFR